jgi:choline dehydrogenase-like flavoprotein
MGADRKKAVVDPYGQTYEVSGLFVSDASLLPRLPFNIHTNRCRLSALYF